MNFMINPISSNTVAAYQTTPANPPSTKQMPANTPQDSVQLSSRALSAGDVDHDGDSH
jgi:hypothetical protein